MYPTYSAYRPSNTLTCITPAAELINDQGLQDADIANNQIELVYS